MIKLQNNSVQNEVKTLVKTHKHTVKILYHNNVCLLSIIVYLYTYHILSNKIVFFHPINNYSKIPRVFNERLQPPMSYY